MITIANRVLLNSKEAEFVQSAASQKNHYKEENLERLLALIPGEKEAEALTYYNFLTSVSGRKSFEFEFIMDHISGSFIFHNCTVDEAITNGFLKLEKEHPDLNLSAELEILVYPSVENLPYEMFIKHHKNEGM
ncbi:hypothetical protein [Bacillus cihuensis]|uniref:hypothetical protein n=1 Tax=Bacillus cihuensis TaxID=1208599 RepID=UPI00041755DE|nr:hypothetical protein [Bacillus cihuensis]